MIRLTNVANGKLVYISPEQLTNIEPADDVTKLELVRGIHFVTESPEEVARKVLEWRLAMEDFKACLMIHDASTSGAVNKLHNLAGLEEPNHD